MFAAPPNPDPVVDRAALVVLRQAVYPALDFDPDLTPYEQASQRAGILHELMTMSDAAFDRAERDARALVARMSNNMAGVVRDRLDDMLTDLIGERWRRWAQREQFEGRDPYKAWTPDQG